MLILNYSNIKCKQNYLKFHKIPSCGGNISKWVLLRLKSGANKPDQSVILKPVYRFDKFPTWL